MSRKHEQDLDEHLERLERRLPGWAAKFVAWLRRPNSRWLRLPLGIFLILAGIVGFLPILGFWMVPLGFIVIAQDLPPLQPALVRVLDWAERKWQAK
jgi:membrane-bound ClpP family serine protease